MFKCELGGEVVGPGQQQHKVVTRSRTREYTNNARVSSGFEIVHEAAACEEHALAHQAQHRTP